MQQVPGFKPRKCGMSVSRLELTQARGGCSGKAEGQGNCGPPGGSRPCGKPGRRRASKNGQTSAITENLAAPCGNSLVPIFLFHPAHAHSLLHTLLSCILFRGAVGAFPASSDVLPMK